MGTIKSGPPEDGMENALGAALSLAGHQQPENFTLSETGGGPAVAGPFPCFLTELSPKTDIVDAIEGAEHIGWRYLTEVGTMRSLTDLLQEDSEMAGNMTPNVVQDPEQFAAMIEAAHAADQLAHNAPDIQFETRLLRVRYLPENWLWCHASNRDATGKADYVISLDGKATVHTFSEVAQLWREALPAHPISDFDLADETGG